MPKQANLNITVDAYYARRNAAAEALVTIFSKTGEEPAINMRTLGRYLPTVNEALAELQRVGEFLKGEETPASAEKPGDGLIPLLRRYAELEGRERQLEAELAEVSGAMQRLTGDDGISGPLMQEWLHAGMENVRMDGRTYYVRTEERLKRKPDVAPEKALTVLRRMGLGRLITTSANSNTLMSWLADQRKNKKPLSKALLKYWEPFTRSSLRSRKS